MQPFGCSTSLMHSMRPSQTKGTRRLTELLQQVLLLLQGVQRPVVACLLGIVACMVQRTRPGSAHTYAGMSAPGETRI